MSDTRLIRIVTPKPHRSSTCVDVRGIGRRTPSRSDFLSSEDVRRYVGYPTTVLHHTVTGSIQSRSVAAVQRRRARSVAVERVVL